MNEFIVYKRIPSLDSIGYYPKEEPYTRIYEVHPTFATIKYAIAISDLLKNPYKYLKDIYLNPIAKDVIKNNLVKIYFVSQNDYTAYLEASKDFANTSRSIIRNKYGEITSFRYKNRNLLTKSL